MSSEIFEYKFEITPKLEEDRVWRENISDKLADLPKNVKDICQYGFTEILNNAIDHSGASDVEVQLSISETMIGFKIYDSGIGVFEKIKQSLDLYDHMEALLELSKGKLTTAPDKHSGEGIFFTSRMFDFFQLSSGKIKYVHNFEKNVLIRESSPINGTLVIMAINKSSTRTSQEIFREFETDHIFDKTIVPVFLAQYGDENLVSRSQAKRLLNRFDKFKEIMLDFKKVNQIGQAFADEIFRVFINNHPEITIFTINCSHEVEMMIKRVQARAKEI